MVVRCSCGSTPRSASIGIAAAERPSTARANSERMKSTVNSGSSPMVPDEAGAPHRQWEDTEERGCRERGGLAPEAPREAVEEEDGQDVARRDEGGAGEGRAGGQERQGEEVVVERPEVRVGPADARAEQRERLAPRDGGSDGDVAGLIEKEPGQVQAVEPDESGHGQDRAEGDPDRAGAAGGHGPRDLARRDLARGRGGPRGLPSGARGGVRAPLARATHGVQVRPEP